MVESVKLPTELLLLVKEFIPDSDLRTHVCYYNTCRTIAALYGDNSQQADFWRRACLLAGIGWLKADSSWKEIAFETIERDGFCTHPHCGGALLDWNAQQVALAMRSYGWDPEDGPWDAAFDLDYAPEWLAADRPALVCSPVFRHVGFSGNAMPPWYTDPRDVFMRGADGAARWGLPAALVQHRVAARSFAVFPAVRSMSCEFAPNAFPTPYMPHNSSGTTVWDVMRAIQHGLDNELELRELVAMLKGSFACIFKTRQASGDFIGDLERFSTLRGLWSITRCDGLDFLRSTGEGPICSMNFSLLPQEEYRRKVTIDYIVPSSYT